MPSHETLSASTLDYASGPSSRKRDRVPGERLLSLAIALAAALLCFNALADAAGFARLPTNIENSDPGTFFLHFLCAVAGGLLTFAFVRFAFIQGRAIVRGVGRNSTVPGQSTSLIIIGVGGFCVLLAAITQVLAVRSANAVMVMQPLANGASVGVAGEPPLVTEVLVLLTFLLGAALMALGVWCCFLRDETTLSRPSTLTPPAARGDGLPPIPSSQPTAA
jgi:hypothetical protein